MIKLNLSFLLSFLLISCVTEPGVYDPTQDDGTYTGTTSAYTGPGTDSDFIDRVCPDISLTVTISNGTGTFQANDSYPNYVHVGGVVTSHSSTVNIYSNNKFSTRDDWAIEETDVQLEDLMNLGLCDATSPSTPGDTSTGYRGRLDKLTLKVDEDTGFVGEFGLGRARGTLMYGVSCTDGEFTPICVYFMNLSK